MQDSMALKRLVLASASPRRRDLVKQLIPNIDLIIQPSEIEYGYHHFGKPCVKNSAIFFNHSYRNNLGIIAISNIGEIGVDIEFIKPLQDVKTFADFSFSEHEKSMIFDYNKFDEDVFFTFWGI